MKKILFLFTLFLGLFIPDLAKAQTFTGTWELFPNYSVPTAMVETPEYVYALSGTSLCGYDKTTGEIFAYNSNNRLNGNAVSNMWYDPEQKYLFVVYSDFNIDLLYDDGRTINVPDLRDAPINTDKKVNGVAFIDGKAYVGTNSGMLVVDAGHGAVVESCLWDKQVNIIAATPKKVMVYYTGGDRWYVADRNGTHQNFDRAFTRSEKGIAYPSGKVLSSNGINALRTSTGYIALMKVDDEATDNAKALLGTTDITAAKGVEANNFQVTRDGLVASGAGKVYLIAADGSVTETFDAPLAKGNSVATWDGTALWLSDATGYGKYDPASQSMAIARMKPNATSGSNIGIIRQTSDGTVYLSTVGAHQVSEAYDLSFTKPTYIDTYSDGKITPVPWGFKKSICSFELCNDEKSMLTTNFQDGAFYIRADGTQTDLFLGWYYVDAFQDSMKDLWVLRETEVGTSVTLARVQSSDDFQEFSVNSVIVPQLTQSRSLRMMADEEKRNIILTGKNGVAVVKMPDPSKPFDSSCKFAYCDFTTDEDGASISGWKYPAIAKDKNGRIWIGGDEGVYVIRNSDDMFNTGFVPMRPKVPRNDGTNLADYLLSGVEVFNIAVDENNDKWISTIGSGLYYVNADGTEILEHFTSDNSNLPSDIVFAACPDKFSNKVFIGTDKGLVIYHSNSSPAAADYNDVYAYPNPVTPDYAGWITVTGLMDGSLVKIADAAGRVFFQGKSNGGMITWNGCDASGRRVKSGVYFVFASQSQDGASGNAAVTKIVVVN